LSPQDATASTVIDFAGKLEEDSSRFYEELAAKFVENKEQFLSFAEESKKNKTLIVRTYQETITDALEACFCFKGMNLDEYSVHTSPLKDAKYVDALTAALKLEKEATKFYSDAARLSGSLLATMTRAFKKVAEKREVRQQALESLLNKSRLASTH
jgi:hypothetical protein